MDNALFNRTIEFLLLPPGNLLLLLILIFALRKYKVLLAYLTAASLLIVLLFSTPATSRWLMSPLEKQFPPKTELWKNAELPEAIVVLGAGRNRHAPEYGGETTSLAGIERLRYAALLHRQTGLPILLSGGRPLPDVRSEAELMKDILETEFHVPVKWLEADSHTTWQNAEYTDRVLHEAGIRSAWLVTQAWHMPRSMYIFSGRETRYYPAAVSYGAVIPWSDLYMQWIPQAAALERSNIAMHEWIGIGWYKFRRYLASRR